MIEKRIITERTRFEAVLGGRGAARILIEASTESECVARCLEGLGHEVIVVDPSYAAMYAQRIRRVKTDRRDTRGLAEAFRLGAYRPAHRSSDESRHARGRLAAREALVGTRTKFISLTRALLHPEIAPLRRLLTHLNAEIQKADEALRQVRRPEFLPLKAWAERPAARRGRRVAVVALARKLTGILYAMMRDATTFDPDRWRQLPASQGQA